MPAANPAAGTGSVFSSTLPLAMKDVRPSVAALAALLLVLGGATWWTLRGPSRESPGADLAAPAPRPAGDATLRGADPEPPDPRGAAAEGPSPSPGPPTEARLPAARSDVPHRVVLRASPDPEDGTAAEEHQLLVIAVDPHLPTADLERLLRDLRERHRDAAVLDIRVYDSVGAALPERFDTGEARDLHRVARVLRNDRIGVDTIRIRGVALDP